MTNQDSPPVRLKGVGDSLWVTLDPAQPVDLLKKELGRIFERMKHLAVNARIILDAGKPDGYEELLDDLGAFLKKTFRVGSVARPPRKRSVAQERIRQRDMQGSWHHYRSDVLMLAGRVRSGQKVTAKKHLLIMGDVNPGAEVIAGGDILVMGSLCGTAAAGQPRNDSAIVLALDFRPIQVQIGGIVAAGLPASEEKKPEFAHTESGVIIVDDYMSANPFGRLPWPQVR